MGMRLGVPKRAFCPSKASGRIKNLLEHPVCLGRLNSLFSHHHGHQQQLSLLFQVAWWISRFCRSSSSFKSICFLTCQLSILEIICDEILFWHADEYFSFWARVGNLLKLGKSWHMKKWALEMRCKRKTELWLWVKFSKVCCCCVCH